MRSLAAKLTLAFLAVGVIGVILAAVFISVRTQQTFDQFLFGRSRPATEEALRAYYNNHGTWDNLNQTAIPGSRRLRPRTGSSSRYRRRRRGRCRLWRRRPGPPRHTRTQPRSARERPHRGRRCNRGLFGL